MKISILGAGSMGVAIAAHLSKNGYETMIWTRSKKNAEIINNDRGLVERLPGIVLCESVTASDDLNDVLSNSTAVVFALPSVGIRETAGIVSDILKDDKNTDIPIISCSKGLEDGTGKFLSQVLKEEITDKIGNLVAVLSGPSYAIEIASGMPTAVVISSENKEMAKTCQDIFMNQNFRVYTSNDMVGVELGGALKNVIALCAGISDGLGFGDDAKAALVTRSITEISRLGIVMGADTRTFFGLTGIGDLILTCMGNHSRNKHAGELIGKGYSLQAAQDEVNMVVEGISTAKPALLLAQKYNVEMPIISEANLILFGSADPRASVLKLMNRDKKSEF